VALTPEDIASIAHLARLGIDDASLAPLADDLSTVLGLVEQLEAVDTSGVSPLAHPAGAQLVLRDDVVSEDNLRDELQSPSPKVADGYFLVPRVIE